MKVGRNDPCPCGSGLKYKNCHLRGPEDGTPAERLWRDLRHLADRLPLVLLQFAKSRYGPAVIDEAWREFTLYQEEAFDPDSIHVSVFLPWFFYEWEPDASDTMLTEAAVEEFPLVWAYLRRRARYEDRLTVRYLEACRDSAFSFLDVLEVAPGSGFTMRDALSGWEGPVTEKSASQTVRKGDILFAKAVTLDTVTILDGCASIAFPPLEKGAIIELRKRIGKRHPAITAEVLKDYRLETLELYHAIAERLLNPAMPVLQNTDGDPLVLCRVTYEIPSARAAFDALRALSLGQSEADLLAEAKFDENGEPTSVEIPWLREGNARFSWESTRLGSIRIKRQRLVAEVNSKERAQRFRQIADQVLPAGSRHLSTATQSVEAAVKAYRKKHPEGSGQDHIDERPEAQALLKEHLRAHYQAWPDMPLPALDGKTPRQAMKTADGREMVEALLVDLERKQGQQPGLDQTILAELRATLGAEPRRAEARSR